MNLTKKQQVLAVATVIIFLMIIWQIYSMVRTPEVSARVTPAVPAQVPMAVPPQAFMPASGAAAKVVAAEEASAPVEQEAYLRLASEYQMIQMQRMIAEGYAAIAAARLNAAKALSELNKYNVEGMGASLTPGEAKGEYELIYLGQQNGEWAATLKKGNQTFDVVTGTVLGKGARVLQVSGDGVVVMRNKKKILVTFNGDAPVTEEEEVEEVEVPEAVVPQKKASIQEIKPEPVSVPTKPAVAEVASIPAPQAVPVPAKPAVAQVTSIPAPQAMPVPQKAPADKADFQELQALLPSDKAKKLNGDGAKPAVVPSQPAKAQVASIPAPKPVPVVPAKPAVAQVASIPAPQPVPVPAKPAPMPTADFQQLQALLPPDQAKKVNGQAVVKDVAKPVVKSVVPEIKKPEIKKQEEVKTAENTEAAIQTAPQSDAYTVQMIANSEPESLRKFAASHQLGDEAKIYRTVRNGKPWYVLGYGQYPDMAAAKKAFAALPGKTRGWTPFIRKLSSLSPAVPAEASAKAGEVPIPVIPVKREAVEIKGEPVITTYPSSEKQLLAAKPTAYTIQLIADAQLDVVLDFIKNNQLDKKAMWYRTTRNGADFYVLIYGDYPDMAAAKQGMSALPSGVQASSMPFIRQLSSIQAAIKNK